MSAKMKAQKSLLGNLSPKTLLPSFITRAKFIDTTTTDIVKFDPSLYDRVISLRDAVIKIMEADIRKLKKIATEDAKTIIAAIRAEKKVINARIRDDRNIVDYFNGTYKGRLKKSIVISDPNDFKEVMHIGNMSEEQYEHQEMQ